MEGISTLLHKCTQVVEVPERIREVYKVFIICVMHLHGSKKISPCRF